MSPAAAQFDSLSAESDAGAIAAAVILAGVPETAAGYQQFFQTGPGGYGEGDRFAGVRVPVLRAMAKRLRGLPGPVITELTGHELHEVRLLALLVLTGECARADDDLRAALVERYRAAARAGQVNNWDLVDTSADPILGGWLLHRGGDYGELLEWAAADDLWHRRIGILGTFAFTKAGVSEAIYAVAPLVVDDRRDLIQKAFGWMLREAGKRVDEPELLDNLERYAARMGRTALSYAVERLTPEQSAYYRSLR